MMKKLSVISLLLLLLLFLIPASAEETSCVINLIDNPDAEYSFKEGAEILEIIFPRVYSSDCAFVRFGGETMLIDASTESDEMHQRIRAAIEMTGIEHFDIAFNTHPHRDHIMGFPVIHEYAPLKKFLITFPADYDWRMRRITGYMNDHDVPVEVVGNGHSFSLGESGEVSVKVIQYSEIKSWPLNDQSAMLHFTYGNRAFLLAGDNENRAQEYFSENLPAFSLKADILKYPHHGSAPMMIEFKDAVNPELMFMNCAANTYKGMKKYLDEELCIPYLIGYKGITRMRTDGEIWVVDMLEKVYD